MTHLGKLSFYDSFLPFLGEKKKLYRQVDINIDVCVCVCVSIQKERRESMYII